MTTQVITVSFKEVGDINLTKNFKLSEVRCKDGSDIIKYCPATMDIVQKLRDRFGAITINSGYRTVTYNKKVGGTINSQHVLGRALDIIPKDPNVSLEEVAKYAEYYGATGIILYVTKKFIHIDTRSSKYYATNTNGVYKTVITFGGKNIDSKPSSGDTPKKEETEYATNTNKVKMLAVQKWLNSNFSSNLVLDGLAGKKTKIALIKALQKTIGVTADGVFGAKTLNACKYHTIQKNNTGKLVFILQGFLYAKSYNPNGFDGKFGDGCLSAVKAYQKANGLTVDGKVGYKTWESLAK